MKSLLNARPALTSRIAGNPRPRLLRSVFIVKRSSAPTVTDRLHPVALQKVTAARSSIVALFSAGARC
jgi:hypothetical protein